MFESFALVILEIETAKDAEENLHKRISSKLVTNWSNPTTRTSLNAPGGNVASIVCAEEDSNEKSLVK